MNDAHTTDSTALTTCGIAAVIAGGGAVTFALFPLAIPFLLLTALFAAPLALVGLLVAVPVGILALAAVAIRALVRRSAARPAARPPQSASRRPAAGLGSGR
jgi:hypothetical protein